MPLGEGRFKRFHPPPHLHRHLWRKGGVERFIPQNQALPPLRAALGEGAAEPLLHLGARGKAALRAPGDATLVLKGVDGGRHLISP